jgi:LmbE family N-acetylglucosaminyl deacetylase
MPRKAKTASVRATAPNSRISILLKATWVPKLFAWFSVLVLVGTTVFWSVLSSFLHESNADQFIDAYLFEDTGTFSSALFPGAHTFLLKWPLFALMSAVGHETYVFLVATILMTLMTLGVLVYILRKIEPRPVVFGLLCLCLASVLLLVPAQPYPGALLPTNFAMTTTRNLEYALFVLIAYFLARGIGLKKFGFWVLAVLMAIVVASDKLFAVLALGSAAVVLGGYLIFRRRQETVFARNWLVLGAIGTALAHVLLWVISRINITGIVNENQASPFPVISSFTQLAEGVIYGIGAVLTNMGANPVHDVVIVRAMPGALLESLTSPSIIAYAFNFGLVCFGIFAVSKVIFSKTQDYASRLTVILVAATLTALGVFVVTDHYYPVDARYLTILLFALFVGMAAYIRDKHIRYRYAATLAAILLAVVLPLGAARTWGEYGHSKFAMRMQSEITQAVAKVMDKERLARLIGDYWDIVPVKPHTKQNITVSPVENCSTPRAHLNSLAWFDGQQSTPSAYLAIRDPGKSTYDGCSLAGLATAYGTPSKRVLLQANPDPPYDPNALLLLYPNGPRPLSEKKPEPKPVGLPAARTVSAVRASGTCELMSLNVVAHQDDDILFMNPDVSDDIAAGRCIRTVYLTAGDAGEASNAYWSSRELGAKAAYADMYNVANTWRDERELLAGRFVTVSYLEGAPNVQLVFVRLPDGNLRGEGFAATGNLSLEALLTGQTTSLHSVDDGTVYDKEQLVASIKELITVDNPNTVRSQGSDNPADGDHSDHHAVGALVRMALGEQSQGHEFVLYEGYPILQRPVNLVEPAIAAKLTTFLAYAKHDGAVCQSAEECAQLITYGSYLTRQYKSAPPVATAAVP